MDDTTPPFLRLPTEIRLKIYGYLTNKLSGQFIHLRYEEYDRTDWKRPVQINRLDHCLCQCPRSETDNHKDFQRNYEYLESQDPSDAGPPSPGFIALPFIWRHASCKPWESFSSPKTLAPQIWAPPPCKKGSEHRLSLGILRTCRKIRGEVDDILWKTNVFSFESSLAFAAFIKVTRAAELNKLSGLHIDIAGSDDTFQSWENILNASLSKTPMVLHTFHITFDARSQWGHAKWMESKEFKNLVAALSRLQCSKATCVIGNSLGDKVKWRLAQEIEAKLLSTPGTQPLECNQTSKKAKIMSG